nr:DUF3987 domain-containing protein [Desulfovibrio sp.]
PKPVRLKDPNYGDRRTVCVWVKSDPPKVSYYNQHGKESGYSYLDTKEEWLSQTPEERRKVEAERLKRKDARKYAEAEGYEKAAKKARATLDAAGSAPADFPYFVRKQVEPCKGLKLGRAWKPESAKADGTVEPGHMEEAVLMPLQDFDGRVWSYQAIFADGAKAHMPKGRARGSFFEIPADPGCEDAPIAFVEGLATGLTVHDLTGSRVIVCCDCGNILPVASSFVGHAQLGSCLVDAEGCPTGRPGGVLIGDNDHATVRPEGHPRAGEPWNPGLEAVKETSRILGLRWNVPPLDGEMNENGSKALSDYNDLVLLRGRDAADEALAVINPPEPPAPESEDAPAEKPAPARPNPGAGSDMPPEPAWMQEDVPPPPPPPGETGARGPLPPAVGFGGAGQVYRSGDLSVDVQRIESGLPAVQEPAEREGDQDSMSILPPPWSPPADIFPPMVEDFISDVAEKLCDGQYALAFGPFLWAAGAAIGGRRLIAVKGASPQPANLWVASLGGQGVGKTPGASPFLSVFNARNLDAFTRWEDESREVRRQIQDFKRRERKNQVDEGEEMPEPPPYPPMHMLTGDTTMEALGKNFRAFHLKGLTPSTAIFCDELRHGLHSLDCYHKSGGGGEQLPQQLLSLYDGGLWQTTRMDEKRNSVVPHCYLSLFGGLQTSLVPDVFTKTALEAGGLSRFLFFRGEAPAYVKWIDEDLTPDTKRNLPLVIGSLLDLPEFKPEQGQLLDEPAPGSVVRLTPEAGEAHKEWFYSTRAEMQAEGMLGFFNKVSRQSTRIALIIHLVGQVLGQPDQLVTADTMEKAFRLTKYLRHTQAEVVSLTTANKDIPELESVHREAARILLAHLREIQALGGLVPNQKLVEWLNAGGLQKVNSLNLKKVCTPLGIAPVKNLIARGVRGRRITEDTLFILKAAAGVVG